jgi:hypothetical protein
MRGGRIVVETFNEVRTPDATEALFDVTTFLWLVPEEVLALGEFLPLTLGREDGFKGVGVVARVPGFSGDGHGRGGKVLHLFEVEVELLGEYGEFSHVLFLTAGVGGDEVGDDLLSQVLLAVDAVEDALEGVELLERGFAHEPKYTVAGMFGSHLEASADMAADEFTGVLLGNTVGRLILTFV